MSEGGTTGKVTLGVPKETTPNERRVALTPDGVKKYAAAGMTVLVESGAGEQAYISDTTLRDAGATVVQSANEVFGRADLVIKIQKPTTEQINSMQRVGELYSMPLKY